MNTKPEIKVYIKKGSIYKTDKGYTAYISNSPEYLDVGETYYEYTLKLPDSEVLILEKQGEVEPEELNN